MLLLFSICILRLLVFIKSGIVATCFDLQQYDDAVSCVCPNLLHFYVEQLFFFFLMCLAVLQRFVCVAVVLCDEQNILLLMCRGL